MLLLRIIWSGKIKKEPRTTGKMSIVMPTLAAHVDDDLLHRFPLSICKTADTSKNSGFVVIGFTLLLNQWGCLGDSEAGESAHKEDIPVIW